MQSLASRHPWRLDVPLLLSISLVLIAQGLTMPALEITAFIFWRDEFTILENIQNLYDRNRIPAALLLGATSVAYPALKILAMFFLWLAPFPARWRRWFVHMLRLLGRWSMLDIFALTAIVVGSRVIFLVSARPLIGLYVYGAGILVLTVATLSMDRLATHGQT
jgi:uncharacterized paraquat-inducible protein A